MARDLPALDALQSAVGTLAGKRLLAGTLATLEAVPDDPRAIALLTDAFGAPKARETRVVGLTGPPGVGKSTLAGALLRAWRRAGLTVGIVAVDPSSRTSGGALLGDRTRLDIDPEDGGVFTRSMAARDRLGGLAETTYPATILMRALFDIVLVESVGVGQSEAAIAHVADTVILCLQPGSGDSLQYMKAGIVEVPDILTVNKADLAALAERTRADVEGALGLATAGDAGWTPPVLLVSAARGTGVEALVLSIEDHARWLRSDGPRGGRLAGRRHDQAMAWLVDAIRERHGRVGLGRVGDMGLAPGASPFDRFGDIIRDLAD